MSRLNHLRAWWLTILTALISVFIVRLLNNAVGYANYDGCDYWYFFGLYQDYHQIRIWYPWAYQLYRYPALVPWIYLGSHMSVTQFHDLKFWTYLLIAAGSFSFSAIRLRGSIRGFVISILFSCSTLVLGTLSTDYVTGAGLAWVCLVFAATVHGARSSGRRYWALLVGALYACCVYTHIPIIMFTFSLPFLFFATYEGDRALRQFITFNAWGILGFLAASMALGMYSVFIGNEFFFFRNEVVASSGYFNPKIYQEEYPDHVEFFFARREYSGDIFWTHRISDFAGREADGPVEFSRSTARDHDAHLCAGSPSLPSVGADRSHGLAG